MRGDGQNQIMVFSVHFINVRAQPLPKPAQLRRGIWVSPLNRHQQAPAVVKEFRKPRPWAGMFSARQRVRSDEMHVVRQLRTNLRNDICLDRSNIRDRGTGFQQWRDFGSNGAHHPDRHTKHNQICIFNDFGQAIAHGIAQANLTGDIAGLSGPRITGN